MGRMDKRESRKLKKYLSIKGFTSRKDGEQNNKNLILIIRYLV